MMNYQDSEESMIDKNLEEITRKISQKKYDIEDESDDQV